MSSSRIKHHSRRSDQFAGDDGLTTTPLRDTPTRLGMDFGRIDDDNNGDVEEIYRDEPEIGQDAYDGLTSNSGEKQRKMRMRKKKQRQHVDIDGMAGAVKSERQREMCRRICIAGGAILFVSLGIVAVTFIVLMIRGEEITVNVTTTQTTSSASPTSSPTFRPTTVPAIPTIPTDTIPTDNLPTNGGDLGSNSSAAEWILVSEIVGRVESFGFAVDFNSDATLVAVAAPKAFVGRGQVEVYKRKTTSTAATNLEEWERVGSPIVGDRVGDDASLGMDLSFDGGHLAVGYPGNGNGFVRVFRLDDNGKWKQQGQTLGGMYLMSHYGASVSLSGNGTRLVVGAPLAGDQEQGMVHTYQWKPESNWTEYGNARSGDNPGDRFGSSVGMSSEGSVVVIGAPGDDTKWEDGGRIYYLKYRPPKVNETKCHPSGCWIDLLDPDTPVTGEGSGNRLGQRMSLHPGGDSVVSSSIAFGGTNVVKSEDQYGEFHRDEIGHGKVRLITRDTESFRPCMAIDLGPGILGTHELEGLGYGIAIDAQMSMIAATSLNDEIQTGVARVYSYGSPESFTQRGSTIESMPLGPGVWHHPGDSNYVGPSVSMASPRMAVGYQSVLLGEEREEALGVVRIYQDATPLTEVPRERP